MATIVNNPPSNNSGGILGIMIILIAVVVLVYLGYVYGLPAVRQMSGGTQINVPSKIDVNINQKK